MPLAEPHPFYREQLAARRAAEASLATTDRQLSITRLGIVLASLLMIWAAFWQGWLSGWWLVVPTAIFGYVMHTHDRVIRQHDTAVRAVQWYEQALARLEDRWAGTGSRGERFLDDAHPYARDLDLFGDGSLFQLLNTAQTTTAEETLAAWLLAPADPPAIAERQHAVEELTGRPQLREDLHTLGVDARRSVGTSLLVRWAAAPSVFGSRPLRRAAPLLAAGAVLSIAGWLAAVVPGAVPIVLLMVNASMGMTLNGTASRVLHGSAEPARELVVLARVLARLRDESYEADRLRGLHSQLGVASADPVKEVGHLDRLIQMHDWQHNMFFAPFAAVLLWGVQCAIAVESWRSRHGPSVAKWLQVVGEFETLAALGTYRFEHPTHPFPRVIDRTAPPVFEGEELAHPLLARDQAVPNDVRLGTAPQLLVVSGSNMSGKTTLLRTVGTNAVLALAGAPVRAKSLALSPVSIGGTLRVQDSLLSGRSRFYTEIFRVKQLVGIARADTLLFLMDELFNGTNSHDRVEGAHGVLEYLVDLGAIGLVTTHDLALAAIGDRLGSRATNVHFADDFAGKELSFDFKLRSGRSTHGNALALMRAVGLNVRGETSQV